MRRYAPSYATLGAYYRSPEWRDRKARYFARRPRVCAACGTSKRIELHHIRYRDLRSRRAWGTEPDHWLLPLCSFHHDRVTQLSRNWGPGTIPKATRFVVRTTRRRLRWKRRWSRLKRWVRS